MTEIQILVVDDDALLRQALFGLLTRKGHQVTVSESLTEARELLTRNTYDLVMLDMRLPDGNGLEFLDEQRKLYPELNVVIITGYADVRTAVAAIKCGAFDYLPKPFEEEELYKIVRNASTKTDLNQRVTALSQLTTKDAGEIIVKTEAARRVYETAERIAGASETTVLILGESGTGKGLLAKTVHRQSPRAARPFIDINCSAIPEQLMESELFGYERGAFTDAKNRKIGLLEAAHGGTIFLDEIGDMSVNLQSKLLKVIEEKEFRRLGSAVPTRVDIRVIAATSRDLQQRIKDGAFREDLYYRLSVVPITLPPLRERRACIPALIEHYLQYYCRKIGRGSIRFTKAAQQAFLEYAWPGNVRELCNVIERCVILARNGEIDADALGLNPKAAARPAQAEPETPPAEGESATLKSQTGKRPSASAAPKAKTAPPKEDSSAAADDPTMSLADWERRHIETVLKSVGGNRSKAAEILRIHRTTLYKKIEEYKL